MVKPYQIVKNRRKLLPDGSQEGFGAQNREKGVSGFFHDAFWTPIWTAFGAAQGLQGSLWGAPGLTKGVQNTLPRAKKSVRGAPK